ncbi:MAG: Holliday junction branch migration protein RuvA [Patescibacteria group bacterium]
MFYSLTGKVVGRRENCAIIEAGGIGFKVLLSQRAAQSLPQNGSDIKIFCSLYSRENAPFELFGFLNEQELYLFEKLNTVSGIGPKTALSVMGIAPTDQLIAAINSGKIELLTKASGIGKKTAERVVLDLKGKLDGGSKEASAQNLSLMESDVELEETLVSLGYTRQQAKTAIGKIDPQIKGFKERLKETLKKAKQ